MNGRLHFHALEKEMATHSSVLAWRIPGTGEPGGLALWGHTESDMTEVTQKQQQGLNEDGSCTEEEHMEDLKSMDNALFLNLVERYPGIGFISL